MRVFEETSVTGLGFFKKKKKKKAPPPAALTPDEEEAAAAAAAGGPQVKKFAMKDGERGPLGIPKKAFPFVLVGGGILIVGVVAYLLLGD